MKKVSIVKSMVRRVIKTPKKRRIQNGGVRPVGEDVNSISTFLPSSIPDLALWIKVSKESLVSSTLNDYIRKQSISVQEKLLEIFKDKLDTSVITEIKGVGNSLIRFELDSADSPSFPTYISNPDEAISLTYDKNYFKLVTKEPVTLQEKYSIFSTSQNVIYDYIPTFNQFVIGPDLLSYMNNPVSNFSEIILYSRKLSVTEKQQVEGYLAYVNNTQYTLPIHHKYLPDLSFLPALTEPISIINDIEKSLISSNKLLNEAVEKYKDPSGNDAIFRGRLTDAHEDMVVIRQIFSKGALLSKDKTIDSIYTAADSLHVMTVPFTQDYVKHKVGEVAQIISELQAYIERLQAAAPDMAKVLSDQALAEQANELEMAQTEEIFQGTQLEIHTREFYQKLRTRSEAINTNGIMMYGPIYKDFEDRVSVFLDAIVYTNKKMEDSWLTLISSFKPIEAQIKSKVWLKYIPDIDISESVVTPKSIQYNNNYLNMIQSQYERIRGQIYDGDMVYIHAAISYKTKEVEAIYKSIEDKIIQPITIRTFLPHFKERYTEISKYMETFKTILESLETSISVIGAALDYSKKNSTVPSLGDLPVIPTLETYRGDCETVYIRRVNSSDTILTGIEYIVTDVEGNIKNNINADGEMDNSFIFPTFAKLSMSQEDLMFYIYHPYKDDQGAEIRQEIKILEPLPSISIIESLSNSRKPNYWFHKGSSLYEIPRDQINGIHQFVIEHAQYPIQLPKYAIDVGSYFLIQNVGPLPIQVQIPGFPDDMIDMIGYGESMLYIYSGLSDEYGKVYYGRVAWREGYIPYDTLLNSPRSEFSAFIKELNTAIYVKKNLEPILDSDGYFIKALTDDKGYNYDIDDVYKANPYRVESLKQMNLSDLKNKGPRLWIRPTDPQIWVLKDIVTGLPVLCNSKGIPGMNEFGYCKFAKTPIMLIDGTVIRGAFGDIKVTIAGSLEIEQMGVLEPFIRFDTVYRSKFVQAYQKDQVKTFVFIGVSKYPILSPKNNFIEAEKWTLMPPQEITYTNAAGKLAVAYIAPSLAAIKDSPVGVAPYPYISVQNTRLQIEMKKAAKIILNRYATNNNYIITCLETIKTTSDRAATLGKGPSEGTVSTLATATGQIKADYDKYISFGSSVEPIQASLDASILTNALKISIDMLDMKMKELIESVAGTFNSILGSIDNTNKILSDIKSVEDSAADLRTNAIVEIEKHIVSVKATFQTDAQNLKITGAPEFDRLLKLMIKYKVDFLQQMAALENSMKIRPEYITEYTRWITIQRDQIKKLNGILLKVREIVNVDIPRVFTAREAAKRTEYMQKFRESVAQLNSYKKYREQMCLWLGIPENTVTEGPIFGDPLIKGLSIDLNVFNEIVNPSVERDWAKLDISAEISGQIAAELLSPIQALKDKHGGLLTKTDEAVQPDLIKQDLESIRGKFEDINNKVKDYTLELLAFEADLAPILKSYENIRSNIRNELRNKLKTSLEGIREKWSDLTSKRTALQTLLVATPDAVKEAQLEKDFEIEGSVNEIISQNPTYYDNLSYFKMKEQMELQETILSKLNAINV